MKKEIVLYNSSGEEINRLNLLDVENIEWYDGKKRGDKIVVFLDDDSFHECAFFEIERVE